jgi:hypothetical protein
MDDSDDSGKVGELGFDDWLLGTNILDGVPVDGLEDVFGA